MSISIHEFVTILKERCIIKPKKLFHVIAFLSFTAILCAVALSPELKTSAEEKDDDEYITQTEEQTDNKSESNESDEVNEDPDEYWTEERMKNAEPAEIDEDDKQTKHNNSKDDNTNKKPGSKEPAEPQKSSQEKVTDNEILSDAPEVPSSVGKMFFTVDGEDRACSAETVNNDHKNVVMTAAHCVFHKDLDDWVSNVTFVPAYYDGKAPYGKWEGKNKRVMKGWNENGYKTDYDVGLFSVHKNNDQNIVNAVGGNGYSWNYDATQEDIWVHGYPAEPNDGEIPHYVNGDTTERSNGDAILSYSGDLNPSGMSGAPYYRDYSKNDDTAHIYTVHSRSNKDSKRMYAYPFEENVDDMIDDMK